MLSAGVGLAPLAGGRPGSDDLGLLLLTMRVAAIQMEAGLGAIDANLERAEAWVREAASHGAEWVALPEFFTSAMALDDRLYETIRPVDGEPARLLERLARELDIVVGGSFLARHPGGSVRNTFVLATPAGIAGSHDKDLPTMWENCFYEGGADDGVIDSPLGPVGAAMCWELIRTGTVRRLRGRVELVIGGSCWWTVPESLPPEWLLRLVDRQNRQLWAETLPSFARLVGAPVVHGNWCGAIEGTWALGTRYRTHYIAEAAVVAADGTVLARRRPEEGPGLVVADIEPGAVAPREPLPGGFWIHAANRQPHWQLLWHVQNLHGRRYRRRHPAP